MAGGKHVALLVVSSDDANRRLFPAGPLRGRSLLRCLIAALGVLTAAALLPLSAGAATPPPGPCESGWVAPTPASVAVTDVPIEVASTTDDYFVLYIRIDSSSPTTDLPIAVVLGEDGTTSLADNLSPLSADRYLVEKYSVSQPADIDGDCIDDLTELADLGTHNPVNPGQISDDALGAVAIPDRSAFEMLALKGVPIGGTYFGDVEFVNFWILNALSDRPTVYFMNTNNTIRHLDFAQKLGFYETFRDDIRGTLIYHPNVVAPDGSLGLYRFDASSAHWRDFSFARVERAHEILASAMPLLDNNLAYHPVGWSFLDQYNRQKADFDASRVNVLLQEDILPDVAFVALNQAEGYGRLRLMEDGEHPLPYDVAIYRSLPNDLPRVAGTITTVPQTPLSHVNLRAVQNGLPNAFIRDVLDEESIVSLIGSYVHFSVTADGYTVRKASKAEVDAHYEKLRPAQMQTLQRDLSVTEIASLADVEFADWTAFGVKAANVAELAQLSLPDGTAPVGFAIPFYFYDEFMKQATVTEKTLLGKKKWPDDEKITLAAGTTLASAVTQMLAHAKFQADYDIQEEMLDDLRDAIKDATTPKFITDALAAMHAKYPNGQSLRYRSSTNNEDLPSFSGAGLYSSKTQDPDETTDDGIDKSIKSVWASLWNYRAFRERDFHRVDHTTVAMGVLVHPNYEDELVNGVAVSYDPFTHRDGMYYVNSQVGEDLVTNPEALSRPEEIFLDANGIATVLSYSNLKASRELLMTDAQMKQLRSNLATIHDHFKALYAVKTGDDYAIEIEFKITADNVLAIKQARPWLFTEPLVVPKPTVSLAFVDDQVTEGDDLQLVVTRSGGIQSVPLSVGFTVYETGQMLVSTLPAEVTIPANQTNATIAIGTEPDSQAEHNSVVTAALNADVGYTLGAPQSDTATVEDDDGPLCDVATAIGRARAAFAWHTDNNGGNEVVFWQVLAYLGADPLPAPPGGAVLASTTPEAVKAFSDGKSWPGWVPINAAMSCHPPPPEVSITAGADIDEGGVAVFTVTADPAPTAALAVTVAVSASGDFGVSPGSHTVTIPTTGSATLTVATAGDSADEADGSVTAAVSAGSGYRVSATVGSASVGVADDDVPVVSIAGGADVGEGGDAVFTVSASPAPWAGLDVSVAVAQTGDFGVTPGSRTVTVPTSGTATLTVTTADDSADEADGSVTATVGVGSGYTVSATAGTAAVAVRDDDDPPVSDPVVSITAGSGISEGGDAVFTVSAVPAPSAALTVTVSVSQTGDYGITGGSRQVTIPASGTATLTVATANDSTDEADGSVTANLSTGAGYTVSAAAGSASVAVSDDDDAVPVADPCVAVLSGDGSVTGQWAAGCGSSARAGRFARFFSFSLDGPGRVTIDLESSADTYLYLRRGVGQRSGAAVASDDDGGGSFDSRISRTLGAGGYTIEATTFHASTPGSFTLTVAGIPAQTVVQPDPEVAIAAGGGITEGGDAVFTVSAVPVPSAALDVTVAVVVSGDFGVSPGSHTVTVPASGTVTLTVATTGDLVDEADGSVTATVNTGTGYTVSQSAGTASVAVADDDDPAPPPSVCVPSLPSDAVTVSEVTGWRGEYSHAAHQQRWDRVLAALGVDTGEEAMTVADAQAVKAQFDNDRWDRTVRTLVAMAQCDDDPPPAAVPVVSVAAGGGIAEGGDATFTVTADPAPTAALTVDVTVAQTGDFGVATGTRQVTVPTSGTVTLTVATVNDSADEADGSVAVTINGGTGYTVSPTAGTATVAVADDDDPPAPVADPEVSITAGGGVTEGGDATFTVTADPAPTAALTVDVTVAQVGDFGVSPGSRTVTVPTGGSVTLTVATANDTADEADGSVTATVSAGSGYTISATAGTATVAVADDDDPPEVTVTAGGGVTEGGDAVFTVTADPAPSAALTVEVTVSQSGDYGVAVGTRQVTIPTSGTVTLTVATTGDSTDEAEGTVTATVGSGSGYTVSPSAGTAAVAVADDDDPPPNATPSLSISDASASEGGTLTFTVTLSPASGRYVWVHYYARPAFGAELSATFADFAQAYGMLTFSPGETTKTITVAAVDDSRTEDDETFRVVLYSASQAAIADGEGIGTITDND
ncbi:PEP/pyruvate-binding domain-containing protein [Candidatus Poriferisodalis sp.]|uniref:PEP/pyruvate-binding domain-containing protein n=1 Tax=Candidatus Poriferisodalis sp. TaxID=3101277 RepID=UPI003B59C25E